MPTFAATNKAATQRWPSVDHPEVFAAAVAADEAALIGGRGDL